MLGNWFFAGVVGISTAWLVKSPGKQQVHRATPKPRGDVSTMGWAILLPALLTAFACLFFVNMIGRFSLDWPALAFWIVFSCIYVTPALLMKGSTGKQRADRVTEPPRNGLSPKVWIVVLPVLFLVLCMQLEFIFADDNSNFGDVLIAWLLPGLASLIILLAMKLCSRESTGLPAQEAMQQVQVQG